MLPTVTIIGRPNVGKSTLFNRIIGRKRAIVDDTPGVTRDWKEENTYIYGRKFRVIDTAGLENSNSSPSLRAKNLAKQSREIATSPNKDNLAPRNDDLTVLMMKQTDNAMNEADVMVFVVDGVAGITPKDEIFAREIRKKAKPVILVVNKCEKKSASIEDFYRLGFGEPYAVSAEHNLGTEDLYRAILKTVPRKKNEPVEEEEENEKRIQIAIIGRPNAGKSTILNKILGQERVIASPVAGTTRDAISIDWDYKGHKLRLIDTAGMRRRANISEQLEKFSVSDAVHAIKFAHVVVLVSDASEILESQDLKMAALTISEGRALVLAVNKWDLVKDKAAFSEELDYQVRKHMTDVVGLPITKFSAINDKSLDNLLDTALEAYRRWNTRVSTAKLNDWLSYLLEHHPPPINKGRRIKIRYITQTKSRPPTFMLACSQPDALADSYVKYIVNDLRKTFDMPGVPIRVLLPQKDNPYKD